MEDEIRDFFHAAAPKPGDETAFRLELNARLAAVEQIRQYHDREIRRSRQVAVAFLAAGLLLGGMLTALILLSPEFVMHPWETFLGLFKSAGVDLEGVSLPKDFLFWLFAIPTVLLSVDNTNWICYTKNSEKFSDFFIKVPKMTPQTHRFGSFAGAGKRRTYVKRLFHHHTPR